MTVDLKVEAEIRRLCGVRKPHEKGKVERAIRYLKDRFFAARCGPCARMSLGSRQQRSLIA